MAYKMILNLKKLFRAGLTGGILEIEFGFDF